METEPVGDDRTTGPARDAGSDSRGLSPVVGVVLLVGIVVLGTVVLTLVGGAALHDSRESVEVTRAEGAMAEFDARASDTALGLDDASARDIAFGPTGRDGRLHTTRDSWIRVSVVNASTGVEDASVVNATLGTVTYANGDTTVAYEGGGVWRADGENATMLSPPEFHFRNTTLTLPIVSVDGDDALTDQLRVRRAGAAVRKYPNASSGLVNRVADSKVTVTVHSDYYRAWGRYFEETTDGIVTYDHAAGTATVKFLSLPKQISLADGIIATAGTGELALAGNGAYTDSYDSSVGPYNVTKAQNGDVWAAGNVTLVGSSAVEGDIRSGDTVDLSGTSDVYGDVYWTEAYHRDGAAVLGTDEQIDGVATIEPIDGYVYQTVDGIRSSNDNDATALVQDNRLDLDGADSGTLPAGTYYFEDLTLLGESLTLDTTNGNITIAVRDYVRVDRGGKGNKGGEIAVKGNNTVRVYVASENEHTVTTAENNALDRDRDLNLYVAPDALVEVPKDRSTQLRVFGTSDFSMAIAANQGKPAAFYGIIYAPAGYQGTGEVYIKQAEVAGAVVTGSMTLGQYGAVHYDEAIRFLDLPRSPTVSRLEYMHVAVHPVNVTSR